jgi:chemotaxis protein methyltransferase CheR
VGVVDVVFCRNVLIYFEEAARRRITDQFAALLAPQGVLVLGVMENLYGISTRFVSECLGSTIVYRRSEEGDRPQAGSPSGQFPL